MNWLRRFIPAPEPSRPSVGLGMLVAVESVPWQKDAWDGEPTGVVVAEVNQIYGYPGLQSPRFFTVAFDSLAFMIDGRGPFEQADVPEARLRILDPSD